MNEEKLKERWQREDEQKIDSAVNRFVVDREGRKFLWWLLEIGRIGLQPYASNALNTAFNCGEMNVGQRILDRIISVSPEGYLTMMKENSDERRRRDAELDNERNGNGDESGGESGKREPDGNQS